uniref:hypothetical protein n=1 Tax=Bradyrhizobium canariense TaxID=255045 RepID=UPI0035E1F052
MLVADRWHLMENASRAFLDAVRKSMRQISTVILGEQRMALVIKRNLFVKGDFDTALAAS